MKYPRITIITPSYNQGHFLEQTIDSVLSQNYPNLDYLIIDGGSTDDSVAVIKKFKNYLSYWVSEKDNGQSDAINKGLKHATGDIFNWLNSDDFYEPDALIAVADSFAQAPEKKIMCGYTRCFYHESGVTSHTYRMGIRTTVAASVMNVEMNQPGSFYRMNVLNELGFLNPSLRYVFDGELWFRFLSRYGLQAVGYTDALIAHFRLHEKSKSVGEGFFEFYKEFLNIHLFLANKLQLMPELINYLDNDQYIERYVPGQWNFSFLEKEVMENIFAEKYKFLLYKDHHYKAARIGLRYYHNQLKQEQRLAHLKLAAKLSLPDSLIEWIRKTTIGKQHG